MSSLNAVANVLGISVASEQDNGQAPFVPQADPVPPAVDRFLGAADRQYRATHEMLLNSASQLEAKAAELRRRADQVLVDLNSMKDTIKNAVHYETECRYVAQSLSLIPLKEGE